MPETAIGEGELCIELFPNPTNEYVILKNISCRSEITLTDNSGAILLKMTNDTETAEIDLTGFPPGHYSLRIINAENQNSFPLIKQ